MKQTILFVETGSGFGGSASCLNSLLRCLDQTAYRPIVAYIAEGLGINRIRVQGIKTLRLVRKVVWWQMVQLIERERVALVHANNELYSHAATILAARWTKRPCVVHMRAIRPLTRLERWLIPSVDRFIILSEEGRRRYAGEGVPLEQSRVIHDGVDLALFDGAIDREAIRRSLGLSREHVAVGIVSRLVPGKGHRDDLLPAIAQISREFPQVRCIIVGGDPEPGQPCLQEVQRRVRDLGLERSVLFTGWRDDIPSITSAFDIAVQSSRYIEGFGTALLEAMALGKPVVATAVGGIPELVEDGTTGFLVPPADSGALAAAIRRLVVEGAARERMGRAGRARLEQLFDQRRLAKQLEALYAGMLREEQR